MAKSTSSQHHAQLIREMNRTRNSSSSSPRSKGVASLHPTISDFDPENEAITSTRELIDVPQNFTQLRASAEKYRRRLFPRPASPKSEFSYAKSDEYTIDTSAMSRAFPDFTQGSAQSADDNSGWLEKHRGINRGSGDTIAQLKRPTEHTAKTNMNHEQDTIDLDVPLIESPGGRKYEVMYTPPLRQRHVSQKTDDALHVSMRQDIQGRKTSGTQKKLNDPSPPPVKTKDSGSEGSRKASGETHRTLTSMHARVRDENDKSFVSEARPQTVDMTARNTRFANATGQQVDTAAQQAVHKEGLPTRFSSAQTLLGSAAPKNKQKMQVASSSAQTTQQSLRIGTIPNITELMSGVFEDGTPVFSYDGKPRSSRFAAALHQSINPNGSCPSVDVDLPIDEHAIFLNIKLLQDKAAILERHNAEAEIAINQLKAKNRVLKAEKAMSQRASRSDSALGITDSDGGNDTVVGQRKLLIEKNRKSCRERD